MKKTLTYILVILATFMLVTCDSFISINPLDINSVDVVDDVDDSNDDGNDNGDGNGNDDGDDNGGIGIVVSPNDPEQSGCECQRIDVPNESILIEETAIPSDLPESYDLSDLMPPVRSQGNQGSCVSWAIAYYLKSYQEKVQYGYEYDTFENVMSPAYIFNQIKQDVSCLSGSELRESLTLLQDEGVTNWTDFPYNDSECSELPSLDLLTKAEENKIGDFFAIGIPETNTDDDYTLLNLLKTLISQDNPIVTSMEFTKLIFEYQDDKYLAYDYNDDTGNDEESFCHAILIVGYDDEVEAFKFVNSWGTNWGNEGYGWLSYDFFRPLDDDKYLEGYSESYIVYDLE